MCRSSNTCESTIMIDIEKKNYTMERRTLSTGNLNHSGSVLSDVRGFIKGKIRSGFVIVSGEDEVPDLANRKAFHSMHNKEK